MEILTTKFPGLMIVKPSVFEDHRGYFFESYNQKDFQSKGIQTIFVQDNQSKSGYGVLRGLHYQLNPEAQAKLVRVIEGKVLDVVVDIRVGSPTFGQSYSIELSAENKMQLLIPRGFAHGFSVLSETAVFYYKCDNYYNKDAEAGIIFNDPALNIDWQLPEGDMILSDKDRQLPLLKDCRNNFTFQ
jgi:dTDP-4-dehydrorhamnose 3,5-epimerase